MIHIDEIVKPTLVLDKERCWNNIRKMVEKALHHNLHFRPHFKTHQSHEIGRWFRQFGVQAITVSSVEMAQYFAQDGWQDITIAFPCNIREIKAINQLNEHIDQLNLLVEHSDTIDVLQERLTEEVGIFIKIDVGYHRTGVQHDDDTSIDALLQGISSSDKLVFKGFLSHAGHSYQARNKQDILAVHQTSLAIMQMLKNKYRTDFPNLIISLGDTPTCSVAEQWEGVDEIRPGNFVFYDLMQYQIGACSFEDIAVAVYSPVVARHDERFEVVLYGGGVHLSKDRLAITQQDYFGRVVPIDSTGKWEAKRAWGYLKSLSQEHGIVRAESLYLQKFEVGHLMAILPVHSCMTVDLYDSYLCINGDKISKLH